MNSLERLGLTILAVVAVAASTGSGVASATEIYRYTAGGSHDLLSGGVTYKFELVKGTTTRLEDAFGLTGTTCTAFSLHADETQWWFGVRKLKITTLDFSSCGHTVDVEANGELEIKNIAGTTNGTLISRGMKVKVFNTLLNQNCTMNTGEGTSLGTITGATSSTGQAGLDLNGLVPLEGCSASNARWTGTATASTPVGMTVES